MWPKPGQLLSKTWRCRVSTRGAETRRRCVHFSQPRRKLARLGSATQTHLAGRERTFAQGSN